MNEEQIAVEIDGAEYPLRYSVAGMRRIKKILKAETGEQFQTALNSLPLTDIAPLLFEGLRDKKAAAPPEIPTVDILEELMDFPNLTYYMERMMVAIAQGNKRKNAPTLAVVPAPVVVEIQAEPEQETAAAS